MSHWMNTQQFDLFQGFYLDTIVTTAAAATAYTAVGRINRK